MTAAEPAWVGEDERGSPTLLKLMSRFARVAPGFMTDPLIWVIPKPCLSRRIIRLSGEDLGPPRGLCRTPPPCADVCPCRS